MSSYAMSCYAIACHAALCCAEHGHAMLCGANAKLPCYAIATGSVVLCYAQFFDSMLCHALLCAGLSSDTANFHLIVLMIMQMPKPMPMLMSCYAMFGSVMLCGAMLW